MTKQLLSYPSKLDHVPSFDLPLSTCKDRCLYFDDEVCYSKNNTWHESFKTRINKLERNLKLIKSDKFVKKLTYAIIRAKTLYFRFFSRGQIEDLSQLIKVLRVCAICKDVKFAIMCNNALNEVDGGVMRAVGFYRAGGDTNSVAGFFLILIGFLLTNYEYNKRTPQFMQDYLIKSNIGITQTTIIKSLVTCKASLKSGGLCETCTDCYNKKDITFKIHGLKALKVFKK